MWSDLFERQSIPSPVGEGWGEEGIGTATEILSVSASFYPLPDPPHRGGSQVAGTPTEFRFASTALFRTHVKLKFARPSEKQIACRIRMSDNLIRPNVSLR